MPSREIVYIDKIVPDAYHGTEYEIAKKILAEKKFEPGRGPENYLGDGVYFFEGSKSRAERWARSKFSLIGIFQASIRMGRYLDLCDIDHELLLLEFKNDLFNKLRRNVSQAYVINAFAHIHKLDTIRAGVSKTKIIREFTIGNIEIFICVRNNDCIIKFDLIYQGS